MRQVDEYIDTIPPEQQALCEKIRSMVHSLIPGVEERFSYRLPFYHYYGILLFLQYKDNGIRVTFCRGKDLVLSFPQLIRDNRAIVAHVLIRNQKDIVTTDLRSMMIAAAEWNKEAKQLGISVLNRPRVKQPKKRK